MEKLNLLPIEEQRLKIDKVRAAMQAQGLDYALISTNANIYYLTGRVFSGYVLITPADDAIYFVKRPVHLSGDNVIMIHKPENIITELSKMGITLGQKIGLELNSLSYNMALRLSKALEREIADVSGALNAARATKTAHEIALIRKSGMRHASVYHQIPALYQPGMSDIELQVEIERISRLEGCLGQFRIAGDDMEIYMGNIIAGDNADSPSPYDFAMGGAGIDASLPVGADGTIIKPGMSVMVDMNGNFTGYMTDMTRTYYLGTLKDEAVAAHRLSIDICHRLAEMGHAGVAAKDLYGEALEMAKSADLEPYFMGHRQHAGFVGHGIGIEVNELPVLAPRSRDILQPGNVIAIEPKFVIPGVGALGIENTYLVKDSGAMECLTNAPEELIRFD